jgi:hypothetical protein
MQFPDPVAGWHLALYPEAGEAGGSFHALSDHARSGSGGGGWEYDPERSADEAARRARAKVRRYAAANGLNRLGTLTYAGEGCHDPRALRSDIGRCFRAIRRGLGGEPFPYLWVPELHPGGHGWHSHFAVGQFIRRRLIESAWGRGFVHIKLIGDLPVGTTPREEARVAARYLSKYLEKGFSGGGGLNRYDVAQGFQPAVERIVGPTVEAVIEAASDRMGGRPDVVFRPDQHEGFGGPPSVWMSWR